MDLGFTGGFSFGGNDFPPLPFEIAFANELNPLAGATYQRNLGPVAVGDVASMLDRLPDRADVVLGGFPCQDVSVNGAKLAERGARTVLYRHMVEAVSRLRPSVFVAENVRGLVQPPAQRLFASMVREFEAVGYKVMHHLCSAADYGVPQHRERVFIIGVREGPGFDFPRPSCLFRVPVEDALRDLEGAPWDEVTSHIWSQAKRSPGQGCRKLTAGRPATVIRAECHGNSQWHYRLDRRISLREAARIQSFPDSFLFCGGMREIERQIGNAVPPVLAWHIAEAVAARLGAA